MANSFHTTGIPTYDPACSRVMRGKIRRNKDGRLFLDFWPDLKDEGRFLWSDRGKSFRDEEQAQWVGEEVHSLEAKGAPLIDAVGAFRPVRSKPNLISSKLEVYRLGLIEDGELQPYTLDGYMSIIRCHCDYWDGKVMIDISYDELDKWRKKLIAKGLKGKTIKSIFAFFRGFVRDHRQRNPKYIIPEFPRIKKVQPAKPRMPLDQLVRVLAAIPEEDRGIFLCMAYLTIRPGEARAIRVDHYDWKAGTLDVSEALKTQSGDNPVVGSTKTGAEGTYPVPDDLRRWLAKHTSLFNPQAPLFPNPRTGKLYKRAVPTDIWRNACKAADVEYVAVYAATKRSGMTALSEAGLSIADIQAMGRHSAERMTREYIVDDDQKRARGVAMLADLIDNQRNQMDE